MSRFKTRLSFLMSLNNSICLFVKPSSESLITSKNWSYAILGAFKDERFGDKEGGSITWRTLILGAR